MKSCWLNIFSLVAALCSCTADNNSPDKAQIVSSCSVENPIEDLEWLKRKVDTLNMYPSGNRTISLVDFRGNDYFVIQIPYGSAKDGNYIYDCLGDRSALNQLNVGYEDFMKSAQVIKILYKKD